MHMKCIKYLRLGVCYCLVGVAYAPYMLAIVIAGAGCRDYRYMVKRWHKNYWASLL